jgi:acetyl-CoA acetyltransferase
MSLPEVFILGGARTPMAEYIGALKDVSALTLGAIAARAALARTGLGADQVDHVVFGNVLQTSADAIYGARHIGLKAGVPVDVPALTVNRLCGSGIQAAISGAHLIQLGEAEAVLTGGAESMSQAPHVIRGLRSGLRLGQGALEDSLWEALTDTHCGCSMAVTAENCAAKYGVTRQAQDEYAHRRLATRPPAFSKGGCVTAGNASGIVDGGAALLLGSRGAVERLGVTPLAQLRGWATIGVEPALMGMGPAPATRKLLERTGLTLTDIDLFEINEAFAAQYLAVEKDLGLPRDIVNVNGGAIALGHPLGMTGTRLLLTLSLEMRRRGARRGVAAACIGGGQGIAALVEAVQ